jgi:hypothetical protein
MTRDLKHWGFALLWPLMVAGLAASYLTGLVAVGTLIFFEALAVVLGITVIVFWRKMTSPETSVTDIVNEMYQAERPAPGAFDHDQVRGRRHAA